MFRRNGETYRLIPDPTRRPLLEDAGFAAPIEFPGRELVEVKIKGSCLESVCCHQIGQRLAAHAWTCSSNAVLKGATAHV